MPYLPSIFNDQKLISDLLDIVQPVKQGQAAPPDADAIKAIASKLVNKLGVESSISVDNPDVQLFMRDLQSLGQLVNFLNINGVKYNNIMIVQPDYNKLDADMKRLYVPFKGEGAITVGGATPAIYKDGLVAYFKSLQQEAGDEGGQLLTGILNNLAQQINKLLGTKLGAEETAPTGAVSMATQVDTVPQVLDAEHWGDEGTIPLILADIKSVDALRNWLRMRNVSLKTVMETKNDQGQSLKTPINATVKDLQYFDICKVINILHNRAQKLYGGTQRPEGKAYLASMKQIAGQASCSLTGVSTTETGGGTGEGAGAGGGARISAAALQQLASLKPFNSQYINFHEISTFLKSYAALANSPEVTAAAQQIQGYIDTFKSYMAIPSDTVQLYNLTGSQFKSWLKNPAAAQIAVGILYDIVHYAGVLYQQMLASLQTVARDQLDRVDPGLFRGMMQQVVPGGPQLTNISTLNELKFDLQQEWQKR
jgi:hypothetical protein